MITRYLKHTAQTLLKYLFDFEPHLCVAMFALVSCFLAWTKHEIALSYEEMIEDARCIARDLKVSASKGCRLAEAMLQRIYPTEMS